MSLHNLVPKKTFGGLFLPYAKNYLNNKHISLSKNNLMDKRYYDKFRFENYIISLKIETRKDFFKEFQCNKIHIHTELIDTIHDNNIINERIKLKDIPYTGIECNYFIKHNKLPLLKIDVEDLILDYNKYDMNEEYLLSNFDFLNNNNHIIKSKKKSEELKYIYEHIYMKLLNTYNL